MCKIICFLPYLRWEWYKEEKLDKILKRSNVLHVLSNMSKNLVFFTVNIFSSHSSKKVSRWLISLYSKCSDVSYEVSISVLFISLGRQPTSFGHQGPVLCREVFLRTRGHSFMCCLHPADGASLVCEAWFLACRSLVYGPGVGDPCCRASDFRCGHWNKFWCQLYKWMWGICPFLITWYIEFC